MDLVSRLSFVSTRAEELQVLQGFLQRELPSLQQQEQIQLSLDSRLRELHFCHWPDDIKGLETQRGLRIEREDWAFLASLVGCQVPGETAPMWDLLHGGTPLPAMAYGYSMLQYLEPEKMVAVASLFSAISRANLQLRFYIDPRLYRISRGRP